MGSIKINPSITANYFLNKGNKENIPMTIMKLLKLVFIAHGWTLAILNNIEGVLDGESVEAWKFGPVIPSLYHEFKHFQNSHIQGWSQSTVNETDDWFKSEPIFIEKADVQDKKRLIEILNFVWEAYKTYSPWGLSQKTHEANTPWEQTYKEGEKGSIIPTDLIKNYYLKSLREYSENKG